MASLEPLRASLAISFKVSAVPARPEGMPRKVMGRAAGQNEGMQTPCQEWRESRLFTFLSQIRPAHNQRTCKLVGGQGFTTGVGPTHSKTLKPITRMSKHWISNSNHQRPR